MGITVFVADDHAIVRDGLVAHLSSQPDFEVLGTAATGRDAVLQVERLAPEVVVLDISMPELDGIEAARRIMALKPDTKVVMFSMHSSAQHIFQALEAGVRSYLLKEETAGHEIIKAIRTVHSGRRYLSPNVAAIVAEGVSAPRGPNPLASLSKRELEVMKLVADGHSSAEIGEMLFISPKTVDSYRSRTMQKLQVTELAGLIKVAIQYGLTSLQ
ncbi:MAG TPA: response regulator transcription factor [Steroidobacteraceae bacterium]|nr:response regulator transcription factor [Steroidobacteraceae bacterium]